MATSMGEIYMPLLFGDIITELNKDKREHFTSISSDFFNNITVKGTDILCIDFVKYVCAQRLKKCKYLRGYTIDHRSLNKILKDPKIRKHYLEKKAEKYKNK